ncbi:MAG: M23 family metallopeptidase [Dehalococcoidia bacterium]|nr:M23 family metallopeptidase [Dehalococcoidia bacterium]
MPGPRTSPLSLALLVMVLAGAVIFVSGACGRGGGSNDVTVRLATPAGPTATPTLLPGETVTALEPPELVLSAFEVYQAGAILVSVTGDIRGGQVTFLGRKFPLTPGSQSQYSFVPVDTEDPPGEYVLKVDVTLPTGTKGTLQETITVLAAEWTTDYLEFTPEQVTEYLDPAVVAEEAATLRSLYIKVTPEKLWDGFWQLPVAGALTSRYGEQRSVNGSEPSGHHGGTDFGALEGTPVTATNSGRVVLARQMKVRGNMVVIDHGGGLYSGYGHLSTIEVTEGDAVEAGQQIGLVGNTGLSTGAHLHWEMASNGILLDGVRFTDGTNGF